MTDLASPPVGAVKTRTCVLWADTLVRGRFLDGAEVTGEDAAENIAVTTRLTGGRRFPVLVDLRSVRSQSAEARAYQAGPEALRVTLAVALIIGSPLSRMIGNFYLGFNKPPVPTRLFTSVSEAEDWLSTFLERQRDADP